MLALIKTERKQEVILGEYESIKLNKNEVLIKVDYCGICGSDLHAYNHSYGYEFVQMPLILGHEISGVVVESKDPRSSHLIGKRVIVESMNYCGQCENCANERFSICLNNKVIGLHFSGGMAEYVKTKAIYVREIPEGLSNQVAALSEPMAVAVHAVKKAGEINENHVVHVQGPGIIGFFVGLICVQKGAKVILSGLESDYENRLSKSSQFNMIPHIVDKESLDEKIDIMFDCSGSTIAVGNGLGHLKKGGRVVLVAMYEQNIDLFLTTFVRNEWALITSYGCDPVDYHDALIHLNQHEEKLKNIISYYPFTQGSQAFKDSSNRAVFKAVLSLKE